MIMISVRVSKVNLYITCKKYNLLLLQGIIIRTFNIN